ncbi:glycosyl hydrolase family 28-related protein [Pseudoalteromonas byunsanensis]|uniref:Uncharacterized protein n=1 Tax=Pseudoalteromonas byunsanensis TaxID=327939 RepID=A0A1S1N8D4_9GAMM|nr:glycosyl hydrolase family 28-related protein [Pseudoalteromonas byunsanensis]OHU96279.1 hypothetical protein BIW53_06980 [Pseudoalteromonas byunsanensis]
MKFIKTNCLFLALSSMALQAQECSLPEEGLIPVTACGAIANDNISDTVAIQKAIALAESSGRSVYIPNGVFDVSSTLRIQRTGKVRLIGQSKNGSILRTNQDITLLHISHNTEIENIGFEQSYASNIGRAIDMNNGAFRINLEHINISGFDVGISGRETLWGNFSDINISDVNIGVELHSRLVDGSPSTGGWNKYNGEIGYYNNVHTFNNIVIRNPAKYGMKLEAMALSVHGLNISADQLEQDAVGVNISGRLGVKVSKMFNSSIVDSSISNVGTAIKLVSSQYNYISNVNVSGSLIGLVAEDMDKVELNSNSNQGFDGAGMVRLTDSLLKSSRRLTSGAIQSTSSLVSFGNMQTESFHYSFYAGEAQKAIADLSSLSGSRCLTTTGTYDGYKFVIQQSKLTLSNGSLQLEGSRGDTSIRFTVVNNQLYAQPAGSKRFDFGTVTLSELSDCGI